MDDYKDKQISALQKEIEQTRRDKIFYFDRMKDEVTRSVVDISHENRTDASRKVLMLIELLDEQIAKHNGQMKRKVATLEKKLDRARYQ